jgi:hypothetical protein
MAERCPSLTTLYPFWRTCKRLQTKISNYVIFKPKSYIYNWGEVCKVSGHTFIAAFITTEMLNIEGHECRRCPISITSVLKIYTYMAHKQLLHTWSIYKHLCLRCQRKRHCPFWLSLIGRLIFFFLIFGLILVWKCVWSLVC